MLFGRGPSHLASASPAQVRLAMRENPVKDLLGGGGTAYGTMVFEFLSAGLPQVLQNAGAQFVFYDM